jgi:hypothetical protein
LWRAPGYVGEDRGHDSASEEEQVKRSELEHGISASTHELRCRGVNSSLSGFSDYWRVSKQG